MNNLLTINENLYNYLEDNRSINESLKNHKIEIDCNTKTIKFVCLKTTTTMTMFATCNSMRYIVYTIDALMGNIIATFGYEGELHHVIDKIVKRLT